MSAQSLIDQGYVGYRGWSDAAADADFKATGGAGKKPQAASSSPAPVASTINTDNAKILKESSTAAINTLQSGQAPLEQRYGDLISNIRATGEQEVQRTDIASAQELAKRGISTQSGYAGDYQQSRRIPVQTAFQGQEAAAQLSAQQAVENRNSAIAQIQTATGLNEVNAALSAYQMAEQARQYNETLAFQKAEAEKQEKEDPYARYTALSEGQTLYDLMSGQSLYTAPKTYKSSTTDNNPGGI